MDEVSYIASSSIVCHIVVSIQSALLLTTKSAKKNGKVTHSAVLSSPWTKSPGEYEVLMQSFLNTATTKFVTKNQSNARDGINSSCKPLLAAQNQRTTENFHSPPNMGSEDFLVKSYAINFSPSSPYSNGDNADLTLIRAYFFLSFTPVPGAPGAPGIQRFRIRR
jgi:hypothetical protein